MTPSWPQQVLQRTLRSVGCPACALQPRLLRLHAAPLPGLRVLGRRPLNTVTVRAQRTGLAEGRRAAPAASFAELGLGQDLLTFLAESRLGAPTEIQVPGRCTPAPPLALRCTVSRAASVPAAAAPSRHRSSLVCKRQETQTPQLGTQRWPALCVWFCHLRLLRLHPL
jgi:hypothetical protein